MELKEISHYNTDLDPVMVSVVCNFYNHEKYVAQAIESFVYQRTNFCVELLLHDDSSTDNTVSIIKDYESKYPQIIKAIYQKQNQGSKGVNNWVSHQFPRAKGKYIALCDGDDFWCDMEKLQKQVEFLESHSDFVIHCSHALIESENSEFKGKKVHQESAGNRELTVEDFLTDSKIVTCTALFRNENLNKLPDIYVKAKAGDWFLWVFLLNETGKKAYYSEEIMGMYRMHAQGTFSALGTLGNYRYYENNLWLLSRYISNSEYKKKILDKWHWYRVQIYRLYLDLKNYKKAGTQLFNFMRLGIERKDIPQLIRELRRAISTG